MAKYYWVSKFECQICNRSTDPRMTETKKAGGVSDSSITPLPGTSNELATLGRVEVKKGGLWQIFIFILT